MSNPIDPEQEQLEKLFSKTIQTEQEFEVWCTNPENILSFSTIQNIAEDKDFPRSNTITNRHCQVTEETGLAKKDRFLYKDQLGKGASGIVWTAQDQDIQRIVAIKTFFGASTPKEKEDFLAEIRLVGKLEHPGIPPVYDVGVNERGQYYFVMKYIQGRTLRDLIFQLKTGQKAAHTQFPFHRRAEVIIQLLRILCAVHQQGIVHRDIKPENILIGPSAEVMLIDWGIALDCNRSDGVGDFCGTPYYMSPEQVERKPIDARSDLYSLSCVFYEFLSLFKALPTIQDLNKLLEVITKSDIPRLDRRPHLSQGYVPSEYRFFVHKGLSKDPKQRFLSADEMLYQLEKIQSGYIELKCTRTVIKSWTHRYMRWLDLNPVIGVGSSVIVLLLLFSGILGLGFYLGTL